MHITDEQIKEFLVDTGIMSKSELSFYNLKDNLTDLLISDGKISDDDFSRMSAYILGIPFVDLIKDRPSYENLSLIPESISRKYNVVSFDKEDGKVKVAFTDPKNINDVLDNIDLENIIPYMTCNGSIKKSLVEYQKGLQDSFGNDIKKYAVNIKNDEDDNSHVDIVDTILRHALIQGASTIHVEGRDSEIVVRYRIKGSMYDAMTLPKEVMSSIVKRIIDLSGDNNDGFKFTTESNNIFVGTFISHNRDKIVIKLYSDSEDMLLEKIFFNETNIERLHNNIHSKSGMIIICGPVKSGKTTTIYSILDILNNPNVNIVTIEENITKQISRINQIQADRAEREIYLRSISGQDADIIMVDNVDSSEDLSILTNLSLTNKLIMLSIQSDSASECLYKISNIGIDPFILKNSIKTIVGQKTLKRLGKDSEKYTLSKAGISSLSKIIDMDRMLNILKSNKLVEDNSDWKDVPFYRLKKNSDYEGRVGLQEVLIMSETIKDLMMSGADTEKIEDRSKEEGMITLLEDGIMKAVMGLTTLEEVLRVAAN